MNRMTRRTMLCGGGIAAAGALTGLSLPAFAQQSEVRWAELKPGFTVLLTGFIKHHRLDKKHGFSLSTATEYTSVPTYYSDFDVGNYDIC
ncbi:twin-arginine translocation pathway signal protein, partial [Ochrobactrum sp. SFR4]|nr:twin-arginine translocation pathway signal protein [Ochrobactrum sp. SFR4]